MTLFLIFVIIFIWLLLSGRASMSAHRRSRGGGRTAWPDQDFHAPAAHTLLNNTHGVPISHTDNAAYSDIPLSSYSTEPTITGADGRADSVCGDGGGGWDYSGGMDTGGGSDFGAFGGGGDFGGGGAGGDWGGSSTSE